MKENLSRNLHRCQRDKRHRIRINGAAIESPHLEPGRRRQIVIGLSNNRLVHELPEA